MRVLTSEQAVSNWCSTKGKKIRSRSRAFYSQAFGIYGRRGGRRRFLDSFASCLSRDFSSHTMQQPDATTGRSIGSEGASSTRHVRHSPVQLRLLFTKSRWISFSDLLGWMLDGLNAFTIAIYASFLFSLFYQCQQNALTELPLTEGRVRFADDSFPVSIPLPGVPRGHQLSG